MNKLKKIGRILLYVIAAAIVVFALGLVRFNETDSIYRSIGLFLITFIPALILIEVTKKD